jgi:hypothetical protein
VIIEQDMTPQPLVEKLLAQGLDRQQIILVYEGEAYPTASIPEGILG